MDPKITINSNNNLKYINLIQGINPNKDKSNSSGINHKNGDIHDNEIINLECAQSDDSKLEYFTE